MEKSYVNVNVPKFWICIDYFFFRAILYFCTIILLYQWQNKKNFSLLSDDVYDLRKIKNPHTHLVISNKLPIDVSVLSIK